MVIQSDDGEKYACDACVRGHRVSSCTHRDRHLNHINKKGRPVSQCPHCRGLRKSRSSHVKCVCGDVGAAKENGACKDVNPCQCTQGLRCTCALKKEAFEADGLSKVAAVNATAHRRTQSKPTISNRRSDSLVPKSQAGHHALIHRMNNAAHEYAPYPIKRSQTNTDNLHHPKRSIDSLPLAINVTGETSASSFATSPSSLPPQGFMGNMLAASVSSSSIPADFGFASGSNPAFMNNALSPANPQRYSLNDFSQLSQWNNFGSEGYAASEPLSALEDQSQFDWDEWNFNASTMAGITQASSVASVEQPGLSRSSSGTASDTGESAFNGGEKRISPMGLMSSGDWTFPAYAEGANFPVDSSVYQEKTPMGIPSQTQQNGQSEDYFGNFGTAMDDFQFPAGPQQGFDEASPKSFDGTTQFNSLAMATTGDETWSSFQQQQQQQHHHLQQAPLKRDDALDQQYEGWL